MTQHEHDWRPIGIRHDQDTYIRHIWVVQMCGCSAVRSVLAPKIMDYEEEHPNYVAPSDEDES